MIFDFEVGDFVRHPARPDWGDGQVQSIIGQVVTVTFEDFGVPIFYPFTTLATILLLNHKLSSKNCLWHATLDHHLRPLLLDS